MTGLSINALVIDALSSNGWWLDRSRSRSLLITLLKACLPDAHAILSSEVEDKYVWYPNGERGTGRFSTRETWRALFPSPQEVFWHKAVWFSGRIPKHAFLSWIAARDRMVTRDKLIRWGLGVSSNCVLCSGNDENRQHLFFDCAFSKQVWDYFMSRLNVSPPQSFDDVLRWLIALSRDKNVLLIIRLLFQAVVYLIWKERNQRIHNAVEKAPGIIIAEIKQTIRLRLDPIARRQLTPADHSSVLAVWLAFFIVKGFLWALPLLVGPGFRLVLYEIFLK